MSVLIRFHPQAWINKYAVEVDPNGETEFYVPDEDAPAGMEDDSYESDSLAGHENAPEWIQGWSGPFFIEIVREAKS